MGTRRFRYFSADNHWDNLWLPRGVWQDRLPARLKERGPKIVESERGTFWEWEGVLHRPAADGRDNAKYRKLLVERGVYAPEGSLAPTDPALLLDFLDASDIAGAVFFTAPVKWKVDDPELHAAMHVAYNDFVFEQTRVAPERLIVLPIVPTRDPVECMNEARRLTEMGFRALEMPIYDAGVPLFEKDWEPLWTLLEDAGVVLCAHIGELMGTPVPPSRRGAAAAHFASSPYVAAEPVAQMILSAIFERHPSLRFCFGESRVGWLPFYLSWLDRQVRNRDLDPDTQLSMLPSEYIKRNVLFTFEEDLIGAQLCGLEWTGQAAVSVWGGDYPHPQGLWGNQVEPMMDAMFAGIDPAIRQYVVHDHARAFFGAAVAEEAL